MSLRITLRTLLRDPGFAGAVIAVLAGGIGLAVAIFTVSEAVLWQSLPVRNEERVVVLWGSAPGNPRTLPLTWSHFERYRQETRALDEVAGTLSATAWPQAAREGDRSLSIGISPVTGNFFHVLGTVPALGRMLRPEDDVRGAAPVAVISDRLWRGLFAGDRGVIGRRFTLHQLAETYTIVGVAPPGLEYPAGTEAWVPLVPFWTIEVVPIGRLAANTTPEAAAAELQGSFQREPSGEIRRLSAMSVARPLREVVTGDVRPALLLLSTAAALLLLIACVNVANLLLVRASGRATELAVRRALGAGRGQVLRELLTESVVLALAGGVLGAAVAVALVRVLVTFAPPDLPRLDMIREAGVPFFIATAVTLAAVLASGLLPALWISHDVAVPLRAGDRSVTDSRVRQHARGGLVVFQVALAVVVLVSAALLARSLRQLEHVRTGFVPDHLALIELSWPSEKFDRPEKVERLYDRVIPAIEALPEIDAASPVNVMPFTGATGGWDALLVGEALKAGTEPPSQSVNLAVVGSHYFRALGTSIIRGRSFTDEDRDGTAHVAMVSEATARLLWPGGDPIGRRIALGQPKTANDWWTVVGLVPETRYRAIRVAVPTVYLPYRQFGGAIALVTTVAVRARGDAATALASIRRAVRLVDPDVLVETGTMDQLMAREFAQPRFSALLIGVFGAGAVLLAAVGLYAVLASVVRQRARELAIRHALGAAPSRLSAMVVSRALAMAGGGILIGLITAFLGGRLLGSLLFDVSPTDPVTLLAVACALLAVTLGASYFPARRAMRADAASVLREN